MQSLSETSNKSLTWCSQNNGLTEEDIPPLHPDSLASETLYPTAARRMGLVHSTHQSHILPPESGGNIYFECISYGALVVK